VELEALAAVSDVKASGAAGMEADWNMETGGTDMVEDRA